MNEYMHTQNIRKLNPLIYLLKKIWPSRIFPGIKGWINTPNSVNVIHEIKKEEKHITMQIEKALEKT